MACKPVKIGKSFGWGVRVDWGALPAAEGSVVRVMFGENFIHFSDFGPGVVTVNPFCAESDEGIVTEQALIAAAPVICMAHIKTPYLCIITGKAKARENRSASKAP
ncbi:hypothetical protein SDC9_198592 [bioreactor metagenome]|uniref:Uncharacterized protein n=1 Tax=bioreactor metagenome TaxID=1076179 RepID=A0A645IJC2_9ZZZZ